MKENKLIASVVVFKELLDNNKDIYDIIGEFLKASILEEKKWNFTSTELKNILEKVFDFKLPEAVIKSTLKNRLVKTNFVSLDNGTYTVNNVNEQIDSEFEKKYLEKRSLYKKTEKEFIDFIEEKRETTLSKPEKNKIRDNINHYLLGNGINEPYTQDISEYIIQNKGNKEFTDRLNIVKEGVVLYTGVRYTADLNELGTWNKPLTIFIGTELLFNFLGYDGDIYKEIFMDFLKLVREINQASTSKGQSKKIQLKYFNETEKDIHSLFHVASLIIENKTSLDPSRTAMKEIVNGCQSKSDIIVKRNKFFIDLKTSGIQLEEDKDYYSNPDFNVEGTNVIDAILLQSKTTNKRFDEEYCKDNIKLFTKINVLRKGISDRGFENCKYILLTGNGYIHYLANSPSIKVNPKDIPFATNLDFITDKFWFTLKKGFGKSEDTPKSFDVITKAQMVLSSQMNNTVQEKYTALNEKFKNGEITKEEAISLTYDLRESTLKPEEITEVNLKNSLSFINDYSIENHLKERELLNQKVIEGQQAKKELRRRDLLDRTKINKPIKLKLKLVKWLIYLILIIIVISVYFAGYKVIGYFKTPGDSPLSIIGFVIGIIVLFPFWKYTRKLNLVINKKIKSEFKKRITSA
ncbi:hypothetical protein [uncultured Maribacter sp.]|uniref:hypothetical protein n=1 Tax=uncultured Maribacter sp. TaxID=431308 RepID=UPI002609C7D0|nr:hypothetical protein [uncultured Maribacter sp.]